MRDVVKALVRSLGSLGLAMLASSPALAQQVEGCMPGGWMSRDTMTGNWGGTRTRLQDAGINVRAHHTSESVQNPSGGQFIGARYAQQLDFGADLDLDRLAGVPGGQVLITLANRDGGSLSADALGNNKFAVQEVFGYGQNFRLVEMHYRQRLFDDKLFIDAGWAPLGGNFAQSSVYCAYFQTLATCGTLALNDANWQHYPAGQWGAMATFRPRPDLYVSSGVYQANPRHLTAAGGFDLTFDGTGVIVPFEVGWLPGQDAGGMRGEYKAGGYYDSSNAADVYLDTFGRSAGLTGAPFAERHGRWGVYALATQKVYREASHEKRGLTLFGLVTVSDPRTETFHYFYAGAFYQGTVARRDGDFISLLFSRGNYNSRLTRFQEDRDAVAPGALGIQTNESMVELDYAIAIAPWLQVRPNLQYVIRPGGTGRVPNAFVIGLFSRATF